MKKTILFFIIFLAFCSGVSSQYRLEIGGFYGGNFYLGDASPTLPFTQLKSSYGGIARINLDSRYSVKIHGYRGKLGTRYNSYSNVPENVRELGILHNEPADKTLWDLGANIEYSFFPMNTESFGVVYYVSPYIFIGPGVTVVTDPVSTVAANLSFGLGVKWRVMNNVTLGAEWGLRKTFTDALDSNRPLDFLDNPYGLNDSNLINNDYYSCIGIFATISLWKYKWKCGSSYMYY